MVFLFLRKIKKDPHYNAEKSPDYHQIPCPKLIISKKGRPIFWERNILKCIKLARERKNIFDCIDPKIKIDVFVNIFAKVAI